MPLALSNRRSWIVPLMLAVLALVLVIVAVTLSHDHLFHGRSLIAAEAHPKAQDNPAVAASAVGVVALSREKLESSGIRTEPVRVAALPMEIVVPGMIEVNADRRVAIRPRVGGVVRLVQVALGQHVKAGDQLVLLDSPDVGTARLDLRARELDLSLARTEFDWRSSVAANVEELIRALRKGTSASDIETAFADKPLGTNRAELLSAYADYDIATHEEQKQTELFNKKVIGEHPMRVASHNRESAQAKFEAALEQLRHDAALQKRLADQQVRRAEAAVTDATERLRILVGGDGPAPNSAPDSPAKADPKDVMAYPIVAPFEGTITTKSAVASQRVETSDVLFTLADLSTVRVVANVPESDFAAVPALNDATIRLTAVAYPGRVFDAKVINIAPEVDPGTRTVRLMAETANPDGALRPGMFARIVLDGPEARPTPIVPTAAVVEIEGRKVVFVPLADGLSFRMRPVTLGRESTGRVAILDGLKEGERVVTAGAFALKSELILENQPEEE